MTTAPTPSELLALRAGATQQVRLREKFGSEGLALKLDPAIVIRLLDRIEDLQQRLVAEARATAEHKLRADQLAQQHRMQAQMHAQATQQLAELEARKPLPLSDEQLRAEFIPWAEIQYRHEDEFSKRDFKICLAAWSAGRRITGGSS